MERFQYYPKGLGVHEHGAKIPRILNERVNRQLETTASEELARDLRSNFPDVVIRTHRQPKKR